MARLSSTKAGQDILVKLGLYTIARKDSVQKLPEVLLKSITVLPFPRNVHPVHNHGRKLAHAKALAADATRFPDQTAFVYAADIPGKLAYLVIVIDGHGRTRGVGGLDAGVPARLSFRGPAIQDNRPTVTVPETVVFQQMEINPVELDEAGGRPPTVTGESTLRVRRLMARNAASRTRQLAATRPGRHPKVS
ncbi:hypothetical protein MRX96_038980 [Rhipicephalus microplus]